MNDLSKSIKLNKAMSLLLGAQSLVTNALNNYNTEANLNGNAISLAAQIANGMAHNVQYEFPQYSFGGDMAKSAGMGAVSGAAAGSVLGPWGAAAGAIIGGGLGALGTGLGHRKAMQQKTIANRFLSNANVSSILNNVLDANWYGNSRADVAIRNTNKNGGMLNRFAFGGNVGIDSLNFPTGLTHVNTGGTHELNPNEGVQMGVDLNGTPNLVEEGEVIYDDYVFSNRLKVPEISKKEDLTYEEKILKKYSGKTYADAAKRAEKETGLDERPNDKIAKDSFKSILEVLTQSQEQQRQEEQLKELQEQIANMSPEELQMLQQQLQQMAMQQQQQPSPEEQQAMMQEQAMQQQPSPEEMQAMQQQMPMQELVPQQPSPEEMAMMQQQPMMSRGGCLHADGGSMEVANGQPQNADVRPQNMKSFENAAAQSGSTEGMPTTLEAPQEELTDFTGGTSPEEMSTTQLNNTIDQIYQWAKENHNKEIAKAARKARRSSREEKEDFVDNAIEDIKDFEAEKQAELAQEQLMQREQPMQEDPNVQALMQQEAMMQQQAESNAGDELNAQMQQPAMQFGNGGCMGNRYDFGSWLANNNFDLTQGNYGLQVARLLGIPDVELARAIDNSPNAQALALNIFDSYYGNVYLDDGEGNVHFNKSGISTILNDLGLGQFIPLKEEGIELYYDLEVFDNGYALALQTALENTNNAQEVKKESDKKDSKKEEKQYTEEDAIKALKRYYQKEKGINIDNKNLTRNSKEMFYRDLEVVRNNGNQLTDDIKDELYINKFSSRALGANRIAAFNNASRQTVRQEFIQENFGSPIELNDKNLIPRAYGNDAQGKPIVANGIAAANAPVYIDGKWYSDARKATELTRNLVLDALRQSEGFVEGNRDYSLRGFYDKNGNWVAVTPPELGSDTNKGKSDVTYPADNSWVQKFNVADSYKDAAAFENTDWYKKGVKGLLEDINAGKKEALELLYDLGSRSLGADGSNRYFKKGTTKENVSKEALKETALKDKDTRGSLQRAMLDGIYGQAHLIVKDNNPSANRYALVDSLGKYINEKGEHVENPYYVNYDSTNPLYSLYNEGKIIGTTPIDGINFNTIGVMGSDHPMNITMIDGKPYMLTPELISKYGLKASAPDAEHPEVEGLLPGLTGKVTWYDWNENTTPEGLKQDEQEGNGDYPMPSKAPTAITAGLSALALIHNLANKPDNSDIQALLQSQQQVPPHIFFNPVGNYARYNPSDRQLPLSTMQAQYRGTERSLPAGNVAAARSYGLANNNSFSENLAKALGVQTEADYKNYLAALSHNTDIEKYNSQGQLQTDSTNATNLMNAKQQNTQLNLAALELKDKRDTQYLNGINAGLQNIANLVYNAGRDRYAARQAGWYLPQSGIPYTAPYPIKRTRNTKNKEV